jgi:predicted nucleic acid-binding protein
MTTYVVDASVTVEYLLRTNLGLTIAETLEGAQLMAPELLDVEVFSVFRRAVLTKKLQEDRAKIALEDLLAWPIERIPHISLLPEAWHYRYQVSAYDAMYVATAHIHQVPLLTADGPLSQTPGMSIVIQNIRLE